MSAEDIRKWIKEEETSGANQPTLARWKKDWEDFLKWKKTPEAKAARREARSEMNKLDKITAQAKSEGKLVMLARTVPQQEGEEDASTIAFRLFESGHEDVQTIYLSKPKGTKGSRLTEAFRQNNVVIIYRAKS